MNLNPKPIRIEPAFDDKEKIRAMFERYAPYRTLATYAPNGLANQDYAGVSHPVPQLFRGDWALGGKPLVQGAELILHNEHFIRAAKRAFGTPFVDPEFVAVNINGPMAAGPTHMDNPSFYGATRVDYPLPLLRVMGFSGLFDEWRVVRASTISWFYEGRGGSFDYWPEGLEGPMLSERPPFGNIAICSDSDRMFHRVAPTGDGNADLQQISASAKIQPDGDGNWTILENGEVRATYPARAIRFSVLWKAEVRDDGATHQCLTLDRIVESFMTDLRNRGIEFQVPSDPLTDTQWILLLQRTYVPLIPTLSA